MFDPEDAQWTQREEQPESFLCPLCLSLAQKLAKFHLYSGWVKARLAKSYFSRQESKYGIPTILPIPRT
jgi:hypothetical protein